ncbi:hypothetical protein SB912_23870, partial [Pantoea sp. SIMBA_072]
MVHLQAQLVQLLAQCADVVVTQVHMGTKRNPLRQRFQVRSAQVDFTQIAEASEDRRPSQRVVAQVQVPQGGTPGQTQFTGLVHH